MPPLSTLEMLVPANAVGKVMGKGGANLANIRKVSSHFNLLYFYSTEEGNHSRFERHTSLLGFFDCYAIKPVIRRNVKDNTLLDLEPLSINKKINHEKN